MKEFDDRKLVSVTKEGLDLELTDDEKKAQEEQKASYEALCKRVKEILGDKVEKVVVSDRIVDSPCCLVTGEFGWTANMERIMKAQTFANADEATWLHSKKTMEINPRHPIIKELAAKVNEAGSVEEGEDKKAVPEQFADLANLLYDSALLSSGFQMRDTADFSKRIQRVIANGLSIDPALEADAEEEEAEEPAAEKEDDSIPADEEPKEPSHDEL